MTDDLESVLRRVASGELTPEEAEPLVVAATGQTPTSDEPAQRPLDQQPPDSNLRGRTSQRTVRLKVMENDRAVVNLRIPTSWASLAGSVVPGLSGAHADRIREAIRSGEVGTILDVRDEDGDGVIISTE
ncbi:MAG: hypothetical protein ABIZ34_06440 [Candidatus Limnocylindrales bacterium]